jgi:hypothetical protein
MVCRISWLVVLGLVSVGGIAGVSAETTVLIDDHDAAFTYVGDGWRSYGPLGIFCGDRAHQAYEGQPMGADRPNTATVTFTGKSATLVTIVGPGCGKVTWDLDDGAQTGELDLHADAPKAQTRVPVVDGLVDTEHRLVFTPVGPPPKPQGDSAASEPPVGSSVWLDGLEVVTDHAPAGVGARPVYPVEVAIALDPESGMAPLGETFKIRYTVSPAAAAGRSTAAPGALDFRVECQVYDVEADLLTSSKDEATIRPDDPVAVERQVEVTPPRYGHYRIRVEVTDKASGEVLGEGRSGIVAMMARNLARDESSQFGAELHPGDEGAVDVMAQIGLGHARVSVDWAAAEPTKGNYVFPLDGIIDAAADAGLTVLAVIEGKPDWASGTPEEFASFVGALAKHYGTKVEAYQLLEAVNTGLHPLVKTPADYVALASAAARAIRSAAPEALVAIGGFVMAPGQQDWIDNCVEILRAIPNGLVDVIAVTGMGWGTPSTEEYSGRLISINAGKENFGRTPMWVTNTGAATAPAGVWNSYEWTEPMQGRETVKCALMAFCGRATRVYLWDLVDRGGTGPFAAAGLLNTALQPKVAAAMVATMTNLINGARFPILQRTGRHSYVTMCQHGMTPTVAFWASGAEAKDSVFAVIGWRAYADEVRILDSMGNATKQKTHNDLIDFLGTETPGYVLDCGEDLALPVPPDMP